MPSFLPSFISFSLSRNVFVFCTNPLNYRHHNQWMCLQLTFIYLPSILYTSMLGKKGFSQI
jgi:hypothetical protein